MLDDIIPKKLTLSNLIFSNKTQFGLPWLYQSLRHNQSYNIEKIRRSVKTETPNTSSSVRLATSPWIWYFKKKKKRNCNTSPLMWFRSYLTNRDNLWNSLCFFRCSSRIQSFCDGKFFSYCNQPVSHVNRWYTIL